ncbi:hemolysin family protein [Pedobacter duraquae]|uniref:Putative hemolysin n=1 Tax=Pedobacter duraquae TaxID=425511 RepID=A0A4R6IK19_9SPHI|nr:hemolysin family protein [Pedobacter duraquae]TDO22392.1 putative hemolysin [Pedobacter duraquae]
MVDVLIILLIIILNGYFSLAELALVSVTTEELTEGNLAQNTNAIRTLKLIKNPEEFLSAVQVGTTLLGLIEGIYGGSVVAAGLEHWLSGWGVPLYFAHTGSLILGIGSITYLTIVFGELVPKSIALQFPLKVSLIIAPSLVIFSKIAYPFIKLLTYSTHKILELLAIKTPEHKKISENDLKKMLGTAYNQGLLEKKQFWMHENVIAFKNRTAFSIMKPARITLTLSSAWSTAQVKSLISKKPYAYFPVISEDPHTVTGILKTKTFLLSNDDDWHDSIMDSYEIDSSLPVRDIFTHFKEMNKDFSIVVDAHQKFIGILTMQDIMEAIFGDLPELEDYGKYVKQRSEKVWVAEEFIHLQRLRTTLSLDWIRPYEAIYLSVGELLRGEMKSSPILEINGVKFQWSTEPAHESQVVITLP